MDDGTCNDHAVGATSKIHTHRLEHMVSPVCSSEIRAHHNASVTARHLAVCRGGTSQFDLSLAASLTNNNIRIYSLPASKLTRTTTLKGHTRMIVGSKFSPTNSDILYSCSMDGTLRIWDLRQPTKALILCDDSNGSPKPFCCFDVNSDDKYACCGTELIKQDAFLLFWDLRASKFLGGYWESHTDDITTIRFRPSASDQQQNTCIASGSVDGLINIFDINQSSEDDALLNTLNTESSVDVLTWWCPSNSCQASKSSGIVCLTHVETLQIWDVKQVSQLGTVTREEIGSIFQLNDEPSFVAALEVGSRGTLGVISCSNKGDTFLTKLEENKPVAHAVLSGRENIKKQISAAFFDADEGIAVICNEDGTLCLWQTIMDDDKSYAVVSKQKYK